MARFKIDDHRFVTTEAYYKDLKKRMRDNLIRDRKAAKHIRPMIALDDKSSENKKA